MTTQTLDSVLLQTDFPDLKLFASGKVRDVYQVGSDHLLFIATDRISAFDYVLATGIPHKGRVLTQISLFWFDFLKEVVPNHLVTADVNRYPAEVRPCADQLRGRSMLVQRAEMFPVECVVRGYLSGSGWKEYKASGSVCGIKLPTGLRESQQLPEPIFTPATKATTGHDENISFAELTKLIGADLAATVGVRNAAFMVHHGIVTCGPDVTTSVMAAVLQAARPESRHIQESGRLCSRKGHHHCRHQVRIRTHSGGHHSCG